MKSKLIKILNNIYKSLPYIILIIADILFCITYYILKVLKEINFYEMIYYFTSDKTGTGPAIIIDGIKTCFFVFLIILIIIVFPITNIKKLKLKIKKFYPTVFNKYKISYSIIILLISIIAIFKVMGFDEFIKNRQESTDIYESYYVDTNKVDITFPEQKRNLIILYLESMESSLMSKENGGTFTESRIPELENLAKDNLNFSNTNRLGGGYNLTLTAWTLASTVASTSGTPVLGQVKNKYNKVEKFMPEVNTLGDVLKREGYNLEIIQGTNIKFAGVNKYYSLHGNYKMFDIKTAKKLGYIDKDYNVWWGYEDKKLFEYSKKEILDLANKNEPFSVSIFTMDTHFKDGYLDSSCDEPFNDQLSNVYACSSKMVMEFIDWLKEQDFYENTTIVIIGDHLTMQNEYYNDYKGYQRTIYNAFINSVETTDFNKNREFSSLDMYPTILASIGANIEGNQIGFGVNLFSGKKTMLETIGKSKFNYEILKNSDYYINNILKDPILDKLNGKIEDSVS